MSIANFNPPLEGHWPNFDEVMYIARKPSECIKIIEEQRSSSRTWLMHNRKRSNKDLDGRPYNNLAGHDFPGIGGMGQMENLHSNSHRMVMSRRHIAHQVETNNQLRSDQHEAHTVIEVTIVGQWVMYFLTCCLLMY